MSVLEGNCSERRRVGLRNMHSPQSAPLAFGKLLSSAQYRQAMKCTMKQYASSRPISLNTDGWSHPLYCMSRSTLRRVMRESRSTCDVWLIDDAGSGRINMIEKLLCVQRRRRNA